VSYTQKRAQNVRTSAPSYELKLSKF